MLHWRRNGPVQWLWGLWGCHLGGSECLAVVTCQGLDEIFRCPLVRGMSASVPERVNPSTLSSGSCLKGGPRARGRGLVGPVCPGVPGGTGGLQAAHPEGLCGPRCTVMHLPLIGGGPGAPGGTGG